MKRTNSKPTSLSQILALTAAGKTAKQKITRALWQEVAGIGFANKTAPMRVSEGTLFVRVASSVWAQELQQFEAVILDRLAKKGIEIKSLRFVVSEVDPLDRKAGYSVGQPAIAAPSRAPIGNGKLDRAAQTAAMAIAKRDARVSANRAIEADKNAHRRWLKPKV